MLPLQSSWTEPHTFSQCLFFPEHIMPKFTRGTVACSPLQNTFERSLEEEKKLIYTLTDGTKYTNPTPLSLCPLYRAPPTNIFPITPPISPSPLLKGRIFIFFSLSIGLSLKKKFLHKTLRTLLCRFWENLFLSKWIFSINNLI